jgi:predicted transcriptional regulator
MKNNQSELKQRLKTFCDQRGLKMSFVMDKAIEQYLDNNEQSEKSV